MTIENKNKIPNKKQAVEERFSKPLDPIRDAIG